MLAIIAASACYTTHIKESLGAAPMVATHLHRPSQVATDLRITAASVFDKHQIETIAAISEIIIPADGHSPGAKTARVDRYIDEIVAASNETTQKFWLDGLAAIDQKSQLTRGKNFVDCTPNQQVDLVEMISQKEDTPQLLEERFFVAVKQSTVDGYYLSEVGIHQDLKYQGNAVLAEFPGCTHEQHKTGHK